MWEEFNYTLNLSEKTMPGVEKMVTTCSSAMQAATGAHAIAGTPPPPFPCSYAPFHTHTLSMRRTQIYIYPHRYNTHIPSQLKLVRE